MRVRGTDGGRATDPCPWVRAACARIRTGIRQCGKGTVASGPPDRLEERMTAPLQLIALTFRLEADAESPLLAEVDRIRGRGVLRVLDMVLVAKGRDGTVEALEVGDGEDFGSLLVGIAPFGAENGGRQAAGDGVAGEPAGSGVDALVNSVEPGNAVCFLLVEHLWASPLADAVSAAGGARISDDFRAGDISRASGPEVAAGKEYSGVIAEAQAAEAAAVLRAVAAGGAAA